MENNNDFKFIFSLFCDEGKTWQYFADFRDFLQKTDSIIELKKLLNFKKCLHFLDKIDLIGCSSKISQKNADDLIVNCPNDLDEVLLSIVELFCSKHLKVVFEIQDTAQNLDEIAATLEIVAYLMKIYYAITSDYFEVPIHTLCTFFEKLKTNLKDQYTAINEFELAPFYYSSLKFLVKILKCVPKCEGEKYLSESLILKIIDALPFPDTTTVKVFINDILPSIIHISLPPLKKQIFMSIWTIIKVQYQTCDETCSETKSCVYNLLCCLSENIYNSSSQNMKIYIHNETDFWNIILLGVTSSHPSTRKKALNVLKLFLLWKNRTELNYENSSLLYIATQNKEDVKIWNDVVILFECLEEKQVHVIKPVLPKFSRILSLTVNQSADSCNNETFDLASAWVLALIHRMLKHETKYVIRWALSTVLSLDYITYPIHKHDFELFIKILVEAFNDQTLYSRSNEQDNYSLFLSSEKISLFLKNYMQTLESENSKGEFSNMQVAFLRYLISHIAMQSWCVVPLLHLTFALTEMETIPAWKQEDLFHIRKIIMDCQRSQEPTFRAALECFMLECCSLFLDWNSIIFEDLADLLVIFKSSSVLPSTRPWTKFASRLSEIFSIGSSITLTWEKALIFCTECIENILTVKDADTGIEEFGIERVARIFTMLVDSSVISLTNDPSAIFNWISILNPAISTLQNAFKRPYMHKNKFLSALKLITLLIKESKESNSLKQNSHSVGIICCLSNHPDVVVCMYQNFFNNMNNCNYISTNSVLFEAFQVLSSKVELKGLFVQVADEMISFISNLLDGASCQRTLLLPTWRILNTVIFNLFYSENKLSGSNTNLNSLNSINHKVVSKIIKENVLAEYLPRPPFVEESEKALWLQFSHKMVCDVWDIIPFVIKTFTKSELEDLLLPLVEEAQKTFNSGPKMAVPHVIMCLKSIIPTLDLNTLSQILDCSWKACLEIRGNEAFRPSLNSLIDAIFQEDMLKRSFFSILHKYIKKFEELSESTSGIFCTFIKQFCNVYSINDLIESDFVFVPVFVSALIYGPIHLKTHKIMEETLVYFFEQDSSLADSLTLFDSNKPTCFVRIEVINYLSRDFCSDLKYKEKFSFELIEGLLTVDGNFDGVRSSQFANSLSHRLKNRAWQAILFLLPSIESEDLKKEVFLTTLKNLGSENQQPSIRYMQEWVIVNLCSSHKLLDLFVSLFEQSLEKRPGYLISIISVLNLLVLHHSLKEENLLIRCFKLITVLCMAQNFTVRLYAQLTLTNLCSLCRKLNLGANILQYEFVLQITEMQSSLVEQGNFFKNVQKLSSDFYFSVFDPIHHFTLETLFYDLPRLSNLSPDEWIKPSLFGKCNNYLPIYNSENNLKVSVPTSWSNKSNVDSIISDSSLDYNFQKKIIPVKDMIGSDESFDFNESKSTKHGLVVVASLIDRIPNLGGLCRTCEIFGVCEFVIGNLRYTDDKTFQNLAVSADKWVQIKEVKPVHLKEYLLSMKEDGYTLVGAEQTEDSKNLTEYQFPKKTVLLLGHEKEGLPVDLIQLLDTCVEIPQQGVIRSLNVHVSGAILIWEYARQYDKSS